MENTFHILGQDITFTQERINYVALKSKYYRLGLDAKKKMIELFPDLEISCTGDSATFEGAEINPYNDMIKSGDYPKTDGYIKTRNQYIASIFGILHQCAKTVSYELSRERIYATADEILTRLLDASNIKEDIDSIAQYISDNTKPHVYSFSIHRDGQPPKEMDGYYDNIYNKIKKEVLSEEKEIESNGDIAAILLEHIIRPLNKCFLAAYNSENYNFVFAKRGGGFYWVATDAEIPQSTERCATALYKSDNPLL